MNRRSYNVLVIDGREVYEHRLIAEKVLGRSLKGDECIHHADENGRNNDKRNLVICPSDDYHKLLHQRMRALSGCGNANHLKCEICGNWDDPKNLTTLCYRPSEKEYRRYRTRSYHAICNSVRASERYKRQQSLKALAYNKTML